MLDQIRDGDILVVWKLDRLARSTRDLLETMETIRGAGGKFQSLSEPWADTTTNAGKMIMTIFAGIAEFERGLIREPTSAGREAARKRGVRFGRPRKLTPEQENLARRLISEGKSVRETATVFKVHAATIYRLVPEPTFYFSSLKTWAKSVLIGGRFLFGPFRISIYYRNTNLSSRRAARVQAREELGKNHCHD
jgi:DNA invertase Pin-like site-specific DNA recombinase